MDKHKRDCKRDIEKLFVKETDFLKYHIANILWFIGLVFSVVIIVYIYSLGPVSDIAGMKAKIEILIQAEQNRTKKEGANYFKQSVY